MRGVIAAGAPIEAIADRQEEIDRRCDLSEGDSLDALRVRGDSLAVVIHLPEGAKGNTDKLAAGQGKVTLDPQGIVARHGVAVPPGTVAEGKVVLDVSRLVAPVIGIPPEQLKSELPGRSLAEVARGHGVAPKLLSDAIRAELQMQARDISPTKLDAIVNKLMTQVDPAEKP